MAQQLINIGTAANDRTGDTWRDAFDKTNQNFTELYGMQDANPVIFVAQESDFQVQDATTITLEAGKIYQFTASFTTAKRFIVQDGAKFTAFNFFSPTLTYSGTGSMFTGTDASFLISECSVSCPNAQMFDFTDSVGGLFIFSLDEVRIVSAAKLGTFNNMRGVILERSGSLDIDDGLTLTGTSIINISLDDLFLGSTSATFTAVDFGTCVSQEIRLDKIAAEGPAGSVGINGAANSANLPSGSLASVSNCDFKGVGTQLTGISFSDVRWNFFSNAIAPNTVSVALLSMHNNATDTTIAVAGTPYLVAGTWAVEAATRYSTTTAGRATYLGEGQSIASVGVTATIYAASGTNKDVRLYIAKNGVAITSSGMLDRVDSTDPKGITVMWQVVMTQNDYLEVFIANVTDTTNIRVSDIIMRIN